MYEVDNLYVAELRRAADGVSACASTKQAALGRRQQTCLGSVQHWYNFSLNRLSLASAIVCLGNMCRAMWPGN
eukprot:4606333-Amphidinium_carterae.1